VDDDSDETFADEVLASPIPVVVDFWAPWCKPCDAIEPHLLAIGQANEGRLRVVRMSVDENLAVPARYGVLALPTVILFAEGEAQERVLGARSRTHYERVFAPHLGER
jgi:thioredoxin 1